MFRRVSLVHVVLAALGCIVILGGAWWSVQRAGRGERQAVRVDLLSPSAGAILRGNRAELQARIHAPTDTTVEYFLDGQPIPAEVWAVPPSQ